MASKYEPFTEDYFASIYEIHNRPYHQRPIKTTRIVRKAGADSLRVPDFTCEIGNSRNLEFFEVKARESEQSYNGEQQVALCPQALKEYVRLSELERTPVTLAVVDFLEESKFYIYWQGFDNYREADGTVRPATAIYRARAWPIYIQSIKEILRFEPPKVGSLVAVPFRCMESLHIERQNYEVERFIDLEGDALGFDGPVGQRYNRDAPLSIKMPGLKWERTHKKGFVWDESVLTDGPTGV